MNHTRRLLSKIPKRLSFCAGHSEHAQISSDSLGVSRVGWEELEPKKKLQQQLMQQQLVEDSCYSSD